MILGIGICLLSFPVISDALSDVTNPAPAPTPLAFDTIMTKKVFAYGATVPVTLEIQNAGDIPANLTRFPPDIIVSTRKTGWDRGTVRTIPAGWDTKIIGPGSTDVITVLWDQKDDRGIQVGPGVYYLVANASGMNAYEEIVILAPEGVLIGSLSPGDRVTSNGIAARLESVVLREDEGLVTVRISPSTDLTGSFPAPGLSQVIAHYQIDDGPVTAFRDISEKDLDKGAYAIVWKTAPVSCNAKELNLQVTKFDPREGFWNFSINLTPLSHCLLANGTASRDLVSAAVPVPTTQKSSLALFAGISGILIAWGIIHTIGKKG